MTALVAIFGTGDALSVHQMLARTIVVYGILVLYLRIAGRRTFGRMATFDNTITILLGAILSRAVVGASPFVPVVVSGLAIVLLQRALAWATSRHAGLRHLLDGEPERVYADGRFHREHLRKHRLSEDDVIEAVREELNQATLDGVDEVVLERSGKLAVVRAR